MSARIGKRLSEVCRQEGQVFEASRIQPYYMQHRGGKLGQKPRESLRTSNQMSPALQTIIRPNIQCCQNPGSNDHQFY